MIEAFDRARRLVLGETWRLPLALAFALVAAAAVRAAVGPDGWWRRDGGFLLLVLVLAALSASLPWPRTRRR